MGRERDRGLNRGRESLACAWCVLTRRSAFPFDLGGVVVDPGASLLDPSGFGLDPSGMRTIHGLIGKSRPGQNRRHEIRHTGRFWATRRPALRGQQLAKTSEWDSFGDRHDRPTPGRCDRAMKVQFSAKARRFKSGYSDVDALRTRVFETGSPSFKLKVTLIRPERSASVIGSNWLHRQSRASLAHEQIDPMEECYCDKAHRMARYTFHPLVLSKDLRSNLDTAHRQGRGTNLHLDQDRDRLPVLDTNLRPDQDKDLPQGRGTFRRLVPGRLRLLARDKAHRLGRYTRPLPVLNTDRGAIRSAS